MIYCNKTIRWSPQRLLQRYAISSPWCWDEVKVPRTRFKTKKDVLSELTDIGMALIYDNAWTTYFVQQYYSLDDLEACLAKAMDAILAHFPGEERMKTMIEFRNTTGGFRRQLLVYQPRQGHSAAKHKEVQNKRLNIFCALLTTLWTGEVSGCGSRAGAYHWVFLLALQ